MSQSARGLGNRQSQLCLTPRPRPGHSGQLWWLWRDRPWDPGEDTGRTSHVLVCCRTSDEEDRLASMEGPLESLSSTAWIPKPCGFCLPSSQAVAGTEGDRAGQPSCWKIPTGVQSVFPPGSSTGHLSFFTLCPKMQK